MRSISRVKDGRWDICRLWVRLRMRLWRWCSGRWRLSKMAKEFIEPYRSKTVVWRGMFLFPTDVALELLKDCEQNDIRILGFVTTSSPKKTSFLNSHCPDRWSMSYKMQRQTLRSLPFLSPLKCLADVF